MIVYKTTNIINNKIYIGYDKYEDPNYIGSGVLLRKAIKKYGKENFIKEIIDTADEHDELCQKEKFWIKHYDSRNLDIGYNITEGGEGFCSSHSEETRKRISDSLMGEKNPNYGKKLSDEEKAIVSKSHKGRKHSDQSRLNMSIAHKGKRHSEEAKKNMSLSLTGRKLSEEHRKNLKGKIPWNKGLKTSTSSS